MQQQSNRIRSLIASLRGKDHLNVLFVCLGNICRSPAAEGVMLDIVERAGATARWTIDSAGTGNYHIGDLPDNRMRIHARHRGYDLVHRCRQVCDEDFFNFDLIVAMDASNERNLQRMAPSPEACAKIVPMAAWVSKAMRYDYIPDPYYEGAEGFELVLDLLQDGCQNLFTDLSA